MSLVIGKTLTEEGGDLGKMEKVPKLALTFTTDDDSSVQLMSEDGKEPKLKMLAYSGKVIKGHWWWGDLAIDLTGMKFPEKKYPILESHDRDRKIAFTKKPKIENNQLLVNDGTFVDTETSAEFQKLSKQGFPYQASIYAEPTIIERLEDGAKTKVNGMTFKGPGTVWRQCTFREASVCVFGWDKNTKSEAMGDIQINYSQVSWDKNADVWITVPHNDETDFADSSTITISTGKEVNKPMTLEELKTQDPEGFKELLSEASETAKKELQTQHEEEKSELSTQLTEMRTELEGSNEKMKELEKKEMIRAEKERQMTIDRECKDIWTEKLADSDLSEAAKGKLPDYVDPKKYLKEDGALDIEAFTEAVEGEIKYWTEEVGATTTVLGLASNRKQVDEESKSQQKEEEEDDDWVANMTKLSGQIQPEQTT
jgi:hypothetical protein